MTLNDLYQFAENDNDITVISAECDEYKALSLLTPRGKCFIGMDYNEIKTEREERQYLAHEIGHCVKGAFYSPEADISTILKQEHRADAEAIKYLVPKEELIEALKSGLTEIWQLCEYFDVDVKYIRLAYWEYFDKII
ncbi:MAG: ImmA/IrrE family metallo-endopeptidase [Clostridia bacterium]|jgi:Zn-dependent peptidase ImmA (M78 family)